MASFAAPERERLLVPREARALLWPPTACAEQLSRFERFLQLQFRTMTRTTPTTDMWHEGHFELQVRRAKWYSAWWYRLRGWQGPLYKLHVDIDYGARGARVDDLFKWVELSPAPDIAPRRAKRVA